MQYKVQKIVLITCISIVIAILTANRSDILKPRNDTAAYAKHYDCSTSIAKVEFCKKNYIGSSSWELGYDYYPVVMNVILGENAFWYYKFSISLIISLSIMLSLFYLSKGSLIPIFFLLLDYRFYAYGGNILRHGIALSFIMISICYMVRGARLGRFLYFILAMSFHNSAAIFISIFKRKVNVLIILSIGILLIVITGFLPDLIMNNQALLMTYNEKIVSYQSNYGEKAFAFPAHYTVAVIVGAYLYVTTKNKNFILIQNVLFIIVLFAIVFSSIGIADRIIAYATPFICLVFYYIILEIHLITKNNFLAFYSTFFLFSIGYMLMFYVHFDLLLTHFNV